MQAASQHPRHCLLRRIATRCSGGRGFAQVTGELRMPQLQVIERIANARAYRLARALGVIAKAPGAATETGSPPKLVDQALALAIQCRGASVILDRQRLLDFSFDRLQAPSVFGF